MAEPREPLIDSGQAEEGIDIEKRELAPVLVSVEQLIPGIKPKGAEERIAGSGYDFGDIYNKDLPEYAIDAFVNDGPYENSLLANGLENQIVVDLGAGNMSGYLAAIVGKAKGYVAVDKFYDLSALYKDPEEVNKTVKKGKYTRIDKKGSWKFEDVEPTPIPVATEQEDMLSFLQRLPDSSVSIISSGHVAGLIESHRYWDQVQKELTRVLSPDGFILCNAGIPPNSAFAEKIYSIPGDMASVYIKKDSDRYRQNAEDWKAFTEKVDKEDDISKLQEMQKQAEQTGMDRKHSSFIAERWLRLRDEQRSR